MPGKTALAQSRRPTNPGMLAPKNGRADIFEKLPTKWQKLRKGVADLHRRCELSQAANERYLEALAVVESPTPLGDLSGPLCHRMVKDGRRYRALNP